ncbi:MAG TPA: FadR/GntR family transcriptional regulator [Aestuariivirgaceae bacterium]
MAEAPRELIDAEALGLVPAKSANAITSRLRHAIETGVFADGDQLPPERQLAVALGTARSTIRKALDQLEQKGLVVRRVGSGTFVNYSGPLQSTAGDVADLISPLQLIETRLAVEPYMAKLAAIHATQKDLDGIESCLEQLEAAAADQDRFTHWDAEFHLHLARCARNPLIMHIYQQINDVRAQAQWERMKRVILSVEKIGAYNEQHRAIFQALCNRDVAAAVEQITRHLETARQDLLGAEDK